MPQPGQAFNPYKLFVGSFLPNALLEFPGLSPSAKIAYARLTQFAGKHGNAHPKVATLAAKIGLSERQTQRAIAELEQAGFIGRIKAVGQQRLLHFPDTYTFLWHSCFISIGIPGGDVDGTSGSDVDGTSNTRESLQESKDTPYPLKGEDGFDEFWHDYPRKTAKLAAQKAWRKLHPSSALRLTLHATLERCKSSPLWLKDRGMFIPHAATWLNGRRWEDELPSSDDDFYPFPVDDEASHDNG